MSLKALQEYTRISKYARFIPEENRRETWQEQVDRVFDMHEKKLGSKIEEIQEEFDNAKKMVLQKRVLGSQRALQFGGDPILKKNARLYNCTVSYCDRPRFFQETMYLLLCGCGVGFSVQKHHIAKLPNIKARTKGKKKYIIPDSIEGWADAIGVIMSSYMVGDVPFPEFKGYEIEFDFTQIRPAGSPISSGSKAPGPNGLRQALIKIEKLINKCLKVRNKLRTIDAYDIVMHSSDAVLSGGVRRSATICIFSPDDNDMATAKVGSWHRDNPQRARSNNSALLLRNETPRELFSKLMQSVKEFGEPGFIWTDNKEALYNPCVHGDTLVTTDKGEVTIREVCKNKEKYKVLSMNNKGELSYERIINGHKTKKNTNIICIEFDDGTNLKLTPDHKVYTNNRGYVKASMLNADDEIVSIDADLSSLEDTNEVTINKYLDTNLWSFNIIEDNDKIIE